MQVRSVHHSSSPELASSFIHGPVVYRAAQILCAVLGLAILAILLTPLWAPERHLRLRPAAITSESGFAYRAALNWQAPFPFVIPTDRVGVDNPSRIVVEEDHRPLGPPHTRHVDLRQYGGGRYSHWDGALYFSSSDGSDPRTNGRVYDVSTRLAVAPSLTVGIYALEGLSLLVMTALAYLRNRDQGAVTSARFTRILVLPVWLFSVSALGGAFAYLATIFLGLAKGYQLPTAAVFDLHPTMRAISSLEPFVPLWLLSFAAFGAALSWLGILNIVDRGVVERTELNLTVLWKRAGLPVLVLLLFLALSGGGWSGVFRAVDQNYMSIAGLMPYSDAHGYFESSLQQALTGEWLNIGARRPLAQAFRDLITLLSAFSYTAALLIQAVLIAAALFAAACSLARWRGLWAALAFTALALMIARPFLFTMMTEPLAMMAALVTIPFLISALRFGSRPHALLSVFGLTMALSVRMGSLILIPFLALWAGACFWSSWRGRLRGMALAAASVMIVIGTGWILASFYSPPGAVTGGNFTWTLCGLSVGGDWSDCVKRRYLAEIKSFGGDEAAIAQYIWQVTKDNILQHPSVFLASLFRNAYGYVVGSVPFHLNGYMSLNAVSSVISWRLAIALLPGLAFVMLFRAGRAERLFWPGLVASTVASAAIIMADDGWRVLHVTHILMALLLAVGFTRPSKCEEQPGSRPAWRLPTLSVAAFLIALLAAPAVLHWIGQKALVPSVPLTVSSTDRVLEGKWTPTGFLVTADGVPSSAGIPSLPMSEFRKLFRATRYERDSTELLAKLEQKLPFALIYAMPLRGPSGRLYNASYFALPPSVLAENRPAEWRIVDPQPLISKPDEIQVYWSDQVIGSP